MMQGKIDSTELDQLRQRIRGPVLTSQDTGYDDARRVWNGMFDRRPSVVIQCTGVADVQEAVAFGRSNGLVTATRGGGHSLAGASTTDGGLLIDLRLMSGIRVDPQQRIAHAQGGATWGLFDRETQVHGLATTGGMVSTTGLGGLTLGGGVGRLMRKHGLSCDNVLGFDLVTADSEYLHVDAQTHPDLFWALRGGGGDFGIVTDFEFQLHPLGPMVLGGYIGWPLDQAADVFAKLKNEIAAAPEELMLQFVLTSGPQADFVPTELQGQPILLLSLGWMGDMKQGEVILRPFRESVAPTINFFGPVPYAQLQGFADLLAPEGRRNYLKSGYFDELTDDVANTVIELARKFTSPFDLIELYQMGGAVSRVPNGDTAFPNREEGFFYTGLATWVDENHDEEAMAWCRDVDDRFAPIKRPGRYINFVAEGDEDSVREAIGDDTYTRLAAVKKTYDPEGFFRHNPNVPVKK